MIRKYGIASGAIKTGLQTKVSASRNTLLMRTLAFSTVQVQPKQVEHFKPSASQQNILQQVNENSPAFKDIVGNLQTTFGQLSQQKLTEQANAVDEKLLLNRQLQIEKEQLAEAAEEYLATFKNLTSMNRGTTLKGTQKLLLQWYEPLVAALEKEFRDTAAGKYAEDRVQYGPFLVLVPPEKLAIITLSTALNCVLRTGNLGEKLVRIAFEIASTVEAEVHLLNIKQNQLLPTWQKRIASTEKPRNTRSLSAFNIKLRKVIKKEEWSPSDKAKVGAKLIQLLLETAKHENNETSFIYTNNYYQSGSSGYAKRMGFIHLDPKKYMEFSNLSVKDHTLLRPRFLPMLVKPKKWSNQDYTGAYYTSKAPIMKATSGLQTQAVRKSSMNSILESLDYLGTIGWRINPVIHNVIEECWNNQISIADLPSIDNIVLPEKEECHRLVKDIITDLEETIKKSNERKLQEKNKLIKNLITDNNQNNDLTEEEQDNIYNNDIIPLISLTEHDNNRLKRLSDLKAMDPNAMIYDDRYYKHLCTKISKKNGELHSLRCDLQIKMKIANQFKDDAMYFPHNIDFRGRAYPIPPNLSHLGADLCRGIMLFDVAKPLGKDGLNWLKIHLANLCGYNKVSMSDRIAWTDAHMEQIRDSVEQPLNGERWWASAESPFQALAACSEIIAAIDSGNPEEYMSRLPVHQDGSCNGLQHYAGLGRDESGGSAVNLVPHEKPQDVYSNVLEKVLKKIEEDILIPEDDEERGQAGRSARLINGHVGRKVIKQTVMTSVYGVTHSGARAQVDARLHEVLNMNNNNSITPAMEKEVSQAAMYLANLTLVSLAEMFESARSIMDWLGDCAKLVAETNNSMSWITPLGLPVMQPYRKTTQHTIVTVMQSITLAENSDYLPISIRKQKTAFPPNFVHSLDATHMMMTSLKMKKLGLNFAAVHDSYWTHPCDIPVMNECLREAFVELYSKPLLEDLHASLVVRFPEVEFPDVPQRGSLDISRVKGSRYFFH